MKTLQVEMRVSPAFLNRNGAKYGILANGTYYFSGFWHTCILILQVHRADCFVHSVGKLAGTQKLSAYSAENTLIMSNFSLDIHLKAFII